jgi:hypothetical protein
VAPPVICRLSLFLIAIRIFDCLFIYLYVIISERLEQESVMPGSSLKRPTIGVLPGWEVYENGNLINYLGPLLYGIRAAAREHQCNLLMACGAGAPGGVLGDIEPAWLEPAPGTYFIPVSPANTDGLIIINPLVSEERIAYVRELVKAGQRIVFIGAALDRPATPSTIMAASSAVISPGGARPSPQCFYCRQSE